MGRLGPYRRGRRNAVHVSGVEILPTLIFLFLLATGAYAVAFCVSVLGNGSQPEKYLVASISCLAGAFFLLLFV